MVRGDQGSTAKRTVAVDLDNTIADADPKMRGIIARLTGVSLCRSEIVKFAYSEALVGRGFDLSTALEMEEATLRIFHDGECLQLDVLEGALEGLAELREMGYSVVLATGRPATCEEHTRRWLREAEVPYDDLLFLEDKSVCAHNWVALVDDAAHNAVAVARCGTPVCLIDYPWNRSMEPHPLIHRVEGWPQVVATIARLAETVRQ
ncbi:MAG: 5' nucleotidase, NT5C type [Chloroflexota bacterium]